MLRDSKLCGACQGALISILALGALSVGTGCQPLPSFLLGVGNLLGTLTHNGVSYQILTDGSGAVTQVISSNGNTFDIGADGNLSGVTTPDGTTFGFVNNPDGTITITFSNSPQFGAGQFTVNPNGGGGSPKRFDSMPLVELASLTKLSTSQTDSSSVLCNRLVPLCENLEFFLEVIFPVIRDDVVARLAARHPELPFADLAAGALVDNFVNDALNNCAGIGLLALAECE